MRFIFILVLFCLFVDLLLLFSWGAEIAQWQSDGLVIERSRVRVPAGAAGECSSPGSTFSANSYFSILSTSVLPQQRVRDPGHSDKTAGGRL